MAKIGFLGWLLIAIATALVISSIITEMQKNPIDLAKFGVLVFFAWILYDKFHSDKQKK